MYTISFLSPETLSEVQAQGVWESERKARNYASALPYRNVRVWRGQPGEGLVTSYNEKHRLMNTTARMTARMILDGKPIHSTPCSRCGGKGCPECDWFGTQQVRGLADLRNDGRIAK